MWRVGVRVGMELSGEKKGYRKMAFTMRIKENLLQFYTNIHVCVCRIWSWICNFKEKS